MLVGGNKTPHTHYLPLSMPRLLPALFLASAALLRGEVESLARLPAVTFAVDRVLPLDQAIATADNGESALNHTATIDWLKWRELKKPTKLTIITDHPKTPQLQVSIRRTVSQTAAAQPAGGPPTTAAVNAAGYGFLQTRTTRVPAIRSCRQRRSARNRKA